MATKNIVPNDNGEGGIGVTGKRWSTAFINTITGNLTGNVTGNVSGTAATVTGAAQSNITSLGNLTTLTVDDITIDGSTISDAGDLLFDVGGDISLDAAGGDFIFLVGGSQYGKINFLGTNNLTISGSAADHAGLSFATHSILPAEVSATTDGTIDLGASSEQFKTIFLSTGVVVANDGTIGSTGTANAISITSGGEVEFTGANHISGASSLRAQAKGGTLFLDTSADAQIRTGHATSPTTALTLDASQNATFAGDIAVSGGDITLGNAANASINPLAASSGAGKALTIAGGSAQSGGTNLNAGGLFLLSGNSTGSGTGVIEFYTAPAGSSGTGSNSTVNRFTIESDGNVTVEDGDLVIGTAGHGITFSSTNTPAQSAGTGSSNTFDDYEEGTFTPTIDVGFSSPGYSTRYGSYTKVGRIVNAHFRITMNAGTANSSRVRIGGLPFTSLNEASASDTAIASHFIHQAAAKGDVTRIIQLPNTTLLEVYEQTATGVISVIGTQVGNTFSIFASVTYET